MFQVVLQECYEEERSFWEERGHRSRLARLEFARRLFAPSRRCCHATSETTYVPRRLNGAVQGRMIVLFPFHGLDGCSPFTRNRKLVVHMCPTGTFPDGRKVQDAGSPFTRRRFLRFERCTAPATTRGGNVYVKHRVLEGASQRTILHPVIIIVLYSKYRVALWVQMRPSQKYYACYGF